jgi:hypothetical protein
MMLVAKALVVCLCSCGLVALAMAGQMLTGYELEVDHIMNAALQQEYTRFGEMFSGKFVFASQSNLKFCYGCFSKN